MRLGLSSLLFATLAIAALTPACSCGGDDPASTASSGPGGGGSGGGAPAYDAVTVEPPQVALTVALGTTETQAYQAFAMIDGVRTEITGECEWSVDMTFGSMSGPMLTAVPHGGATQVVANCKGVAGASDLTVNLVGVIIGGTNTPQDAPEIFDGATPGMDPARTPAIVYPIEGAIAPLNLPAVDSQWLPAGNDLFHLSLASEYLDIDFYTTDISGLLAQGDWEAVAETAAGGDLVFVVEGLLQADPTTKFPSTPVTMEMSRDTIDKTAIYYWASSQGNLMTQIFGTTTAPTALKGDCTSCHSVSRSGKRIGYSRCVGGTCADIRIGFMRYDPVTMTWVDTINANSSMNPIVGSYTTFSPVGNPFPDDEQAAVIISMSTGRLDLYDPDTGAVLPSNLADFSTHGPGAPRAALMADWSPDGDHVVFASTPHPGQWIDLSDSSIAKMSYTFDGATHAFGEPEFIVAEPITLPSGVYNNFFFPSFSPDGQYIVFNAARSAWRNGANAAAPGQRLMLTDANGSWKVELEAMNGQGDLDITWPHWAPGGTNDYLWVVFSSERPYGHKVTPQNSNPSCIANGVQQCKQLWIGAVDKQKLMAGMPVDPSAPPVWLPGQDIGADNISPYWTVPADVTPE